MRDIRNVDLNLLKAFEALLDEQSVSRAAQRLSVTQPAMSAMLARLRDSFDDPLFIRAQHGIKPTNRALALNKDVKQVLAQIAQMLTPTDFDPGVADFTFSIAATDYGHSAIVLPFLQQLRQLAPKLQIALLPIQDTSVQQQLERGEIDLAIMNPIRIRSQQVYTKMLYQEHYVLAMRKGHPVANIKMDLDVFCDLDFVMMSYDGGLFTGATDEALSMLGRSRRVSISVNSFSLIPKILHDSDSVAMLPSRLLKQYSGLITIRPPLDILGFSNVMVWHERAHHDTGHRWIRGHLVESISSDTKDTNNHT